MVEEKKPLLAKEIILKEYKEDFEGLGQIENSWFKVDSKGTPVQHAPWRVPFGLRSEVQDKIA